MPGATGKEVVIFDLYPDTGSSSSCSMSRYRRPKPHDSISKVTDIVAKDLVASTLTGSPAAAMYNSSTPYGM